VRWLLINLTVRSRHVSTGHQLLRLSEYVNFHILSSPFRFLIIVEEKIPDVDHIAEEMTCPVEAFGMVVNVVSPISLRQSLVGMSEPNTRHTTDFLTTGA
jgi:hypothetical protein